MRIKKVICDQANRFVAPKFGKFEFFENIEAGEGSDHGKSRFVFAGANFIACGAAARLGGGAAAAPE